ncbi:MAG: tftB [Alphaproteobacteria bacterium]|nr:tftB [Alphaproteobacteria bacterium]
MSMTSDDPTQIATHLLALEGLCLDRRDWKRWLDLYDEDVVYRIPAWRDEDEETQDPNSEVSLIYHDSRTGLEDRAARIAAGRTATTMPLPRTAHFVGNIVAARAGDGVIEAEASWNVHVYQPRTAKQSVHFGRYEVQLRKKGEIWRISRKTIHLQNDRVSTVLDFYSV